MDCGDNPSILVASCNGLQSSYIIKKMLEKEGLPITTRIVDGIEVYPWHISTKYYETDVVIYALTEKMLLSQRLANTVQSVIIFFDSTKDNGIDEVEGWLSFLKDYDADISILVCHRCSDTLGAGVSKLNAQEWCVQRGFELVELDPVVDEEWEAEQDFTETTGIKRIVQALHAHVWPNLTLKERKEPTSMSALLHGGDLRSEADVEQPDSPPLPPDLSECNIEERLEELLGGSSDTDFYQLFGELHTMKERVAQLPSDQRKACAEQVVLAFWRAIGGDEEEVDSIIDSDPSTS